MAAFRYRGVIEGFYGPPYSDGARRWLIERMGRWGMNVYVYAPKDDPLGRAEWRKPYPAADAEGFRRLVEAGNRANVNVGFTVSPGLSIEYSSGSDRENLHTKLGRFAELGARVLCLALDDVSSELVHAADRNRYSSLAAAHASLANEVLERLPEGRRLWLVPTDYQGSESSAYLQELGAELDPKIEVGWTGRTVVSPTITGAEAESRAKAVGRRLLIWDNVPVSDGPMRPMLHLGPYVGRAANLPEFARGVLLNPMQHAHASAITLRTAADYLRDPAEYDPEASWREAVSEVGEGASDALETFAAAHRFSALLPQDRDPELDTAFSAMREGHAMGAPPGRALAELRAAVRRRVQTRALLRRDLFDRELLAEIEPWVEAHHSEAQRMSAAVDFLETLASDGSAMEKVLAFFRFEGRLTHIDTPRVASFGPRRVVYPQLGSLRDATAGFGSDPALFVDRCLADDVVRYAEDRARETLVADSRDA